MTNRCCAVVDSIACEAPPGYGEPATNVVSCWACGDDVCRACSAIVRYRWKDQHRRVRFCATCQEQRGVRAA